MNTENEIEYCVRIIKRKSYWNDNNYRCSDDEEPYVISYDNIADLYECIARERNLWQIEVENICKLSKSGYYQRKIEDYDFEVSEIYTVVEEFSMDKLKATEEYKKLGAARDAAIKKEKEQKAAEEIRRVEFKKKQQEEYDRTEFARLSKKFATK